MNNHLNAAHAVWKRLLQPGKLAVDATCGNGRDTLVLAETGAQVIACDCQKIALDRARQRLEGRENVAWVHGCHAELPKAITQPITVLVYNLGYLPGGDKSLTTQTETTLKSVEQLLPRIEPGGLVSITCYPGHPEGAREEKALLAFTSSLNPRTWRVSHQRWRENALAPSLLLLRKTPIFSQNLAKNTP